MLVKRWLWKITGALTPEKKARGLRVIAKLKALQSDVSSLKIAFDKEASSALLSDESAWKLIGFDESLLKLRLHLTSQTNITALGRFIFTGDYSFVKEVMLSCYGLQSLPIVAMLITEFEQTETPEKLCDKVSVLNTSDLYGIAVADVLTDHGFTMVKTDRRAKFTLVHPFMPDFTLELVFKMKNNGTDLKFSKAIFDMVDDDSSFAAYEESFHFTDEE